MQENALETRRFKTADQRRDVKEHGGISIVKMTDCSTGMHAIFESGWTGEADEKPLPGSPGSCRCGTPATAFRAGWLSG